MTRTRRHVIPTTSIRRRDIPPRSYQSPLREEQAAATRERILEAAHRLLGRIRPVDLAYAQIAEEAQVSVRTVYRHFPTSDELFLALSDRLLGALYADLPRDRMPNLVEARSLLDRQFQMMEADPALYRVFFAVPTRSRNSSDTMIDALFGPRLARLDPAGKRAVLGLLDLLGSPYAWDVLHANWGLDAGEAMRAVLYGMRAVLELSERTPEALAPGADPFPPDPESP